MKRGNGILQSHDSKNNSERKNPVEEEDRKLWKRIDIQHADKTLHC